MLIKHYIYNVTGTDPNSIGDQNQYSSYFPICKFLFSLCNSGKWTLRCHLLKKNLLIETGGSVQDINIRDFHANMIPPVFIDKFHAKFLKRGSYRTKIIFKKNLCVPNIYFYSNWDLEFNPWSPYLILSLLLKPETKSKKSIKAQFLQHCHFKWHLLI